MKNKSMQTNAQEILGMTLSDAMSSVDAELSNTALRITKDSGNREVNPDNGFNRDTEDGKFCMSDWLLDFVEWVYDKTSIELDEQIDTEPYLNTDYDIEVDADDTSLIHPLFTNRLQALLQRGAKKYGAWNWQRGANLSRFYNSLIRHAIQWALGDTSEDHLSAIAFNAMGLMVYEHTLQHGKQFTDEQGNVLGKFPEFADLGALAKDPTRYAIGVDLGVPEGDTTEVTVIKIEIE